MKIEAMLAFADSEVLSTTADAAARTLALRFSAAKVEGGWLRGVALVLGDARWTGVPADALGRVVAGRVRVDGVDTPLALSCRLAGAIAIELRFANGTALAAEGRTLALDVDDDARFAPDFSC